MSCALVEGSYILVGGKDVLKLSADVTVVDATAFDNVGMFGVKKTKLHRNEDEGDQKRRGVALSHAINSVDGGVVRASNLDVALEVGVEVMDNLGVLGVNASLDKELFNKVVVEKVEKLKEIHQ